MKDCRPVKGLNTLIKAVQSLCLEKWKKGLNLRSLNEYFNIVKLSGLKCSRGGGASVSYSK